jgi:hypothetical protein
VHIVGFIIRIIKYTLIELRFVVIKVIFIIIIIIIIIIMQPG